MRGPVRPGPGLGMLALLLVAVSGCQDEGGGGPDSPPPSTAPDLSEADLWLSFDGDEVGPDGAPEFPDAAGGSWRATVVSANGGEVELVSGDGSAGAVEFPPLCDAEVACPRAMVELAAAPQLDPGDRDFEFGATVWLAPEQTTRGSNVVQSGRFGSDGGQWKLQVDSDEGHPSCVVRGADPAAEPVVAVSEISISDSAWHRVVCRRDADGVTIEVDGTPVEEPGVTGSVTNEAPIRIGAPGVNDGDDQFHGRVDDVYLMIGS